MKKQSNNLFGTISKKQVINLTSIVKETLATDFEIPVNKIFTAIDLWSIQRQGKTFSKSRHSFL